MSSSLSEDQRKQLDALGFVWQTRDAAWEKGFQSLILFKEREGHCLVPQTHAENGFRLGQWVGEQRTNRHSIAEDRPRRLDELGFVWQARDDAWENGFQLLTLFKEREGHCLVPQTHAENGFRLGHWVNRMRARRGALSPERIRRLGELGFIWEIR
jgi:hypothetical protein